jgi:hypothetical protein
MNFSPYKILRVSRLQQPSLQRTLRYFSRILGEKIVIPKIVSLFNFKVVVKKALDVALLLWRAEHYHH